MALKPINDRQQSLPPNHSSLHLKLDTTPVAIPAFLQDILSAHPTPPTPSPAVPGPALYTLPQAPPPPEDPLIPPENFSVVCSGVYRSGFPKKRNFEFMETLRLKTVLTLVLEDYPDANLKWCEERDVQFMVGLCAAGRSRTHSDQQFGIPGNKVGQCGEAALHPFSLNLIMLTVPGTVRQYPRRRHLFSARRHSRQAQSSHSHPLQQGKGESRSSRRLHRLSRQHRTGCLIGCIRRLQSWSLTSIFDE